MIYKLKAFKLVIALTLISQPLLAQSADPTTELTFGVNQKNPEFELERR
jgi:hypothetical protein